MLLVVWEVVNGRTLGVMYVRLRSAADPCAGGLGRASHHTPLPHIRASHHTPLPHHPAPSCSSRSHHVIRQHIIRQRRMLRSQSSPKQRWHPRLCLRTTVRRGRHGHCCGFLSLIPHPKVSSPLLRRHSPVAYSCLRSQRISGVQQSARRKRARRDPRTRPTAAQCSCSISCLLY